MELFVFDIDGTLVADFGEMTNEVVSSLNKLLERGDMVVFASGRCQSGVKRYMDCLIPSKNKFVLACNGAVTYDSEGNLISRTGLTYADFLYITKKYSCGIGVPYFYRDNMLGTFMPDENICKMEYELNRMDGLIDLNKTELPLDYPIDKTLVAALPKNSIWLEKHIDEEDKLKYHDVRSSPVFLEFINNDVDKSTGIEHLIEKIGISKKHVHTFGDSMNDEGMIKEFDGTAMGNALDDIKKVAKRVTKSVDEDGVAYALKTWFGVK